MPEAVARTGDLDPLADRNLGVGAKITAVTNQRFARAENLTCPTLPVFDPELFGLQGKTMDSWESVRHNPADFDSLELTLLKTSNIRYLSLSTKFHDGNHPDFVRVRARAPRSGSSSPGEWFELLPKTAAKGHSLYRIDLGALSGPVSEVAVDMYPDGGLTRLGLYKELPLEAARDFAKGEWVRFKDEIPKTSKPLAIPYRALPGEIEKNLNRSAMPNFASAALGARVLSASNEHYGPAVQVISPYPPLNMFDGLESARSREPGHSEEVVVQLARPVQITSVVLDFTYFLNNNPARVAIEGRSNEKWEVIVEPTDVKAFAGNQKTFRIEGQTIFGEIRVRTFPDGGINRIRVFGRAATPQ